MRFSCTILQGAAKLSFPGYKNVFPALAFIFFPFYIIPTYIYFNGIWSYSNSMKDYWPLRARQFTSTTILLGLDCHSFPIQQIPHVYVSVSNLAPATTVPRLQAQRHRAASPPPALAYHFCLNLPATFSQPGNSNLAKPCTIGQNGPQRGEEVPFTQDIHKNWQRIFWCINVRSTHEHGIHRRRGDTK